MPRQQRYSVYLHFDLDACGVKDAQECVEDIIRRAGLYGSHVYMQDHKKGSAYRKLHRGKWTKDKG